MINLDLKQHWAGMGDSLRTEGAADKKPKPGYIAELTLT